MNNHARWLKDPQAYDLYLQYMQFIQAEELERQLAKQKEDEEVSA